MLLLAAMPMAAGPVLRQLHIYVELLDNGDARITEERTMSIDNEGTEGYIVIGNLNGSKIRDFAVSDEKGKDYIMEGAWDIKRSRMEKARRCGIVTKDNGYELCWGLGNSGDRVYIIRYTVTGLVRSYKNSDGFNFMFLARDVKPSPKDAKITISSPDLAKGFPPDSIKIWSFGYPGRIDKVDGEVEAYSSAALSPNHYMTVMMELEKGVLHPVMTENKDFKEVRERAFEGSDYEEPSWWSKAWHQLTHDTESLFGSLFLVGFLGFAGWGGYRKRKTRKELLKDIEWYRDIPCNGDLLRANGFMKTLLSSSNDNLISAMVLRLIRTSALRIEEHFVEATGLKRLTGNKGEVQQCIVIGDFNPRNRLINSAPIQKLYEMFKEAAGSDRILQPKELKKWMKANEIEVMEFLKLLDKNVSLKECKANAEEVRQVFGLKMFLSDFTLANERHLSEVALWNDYLIYATLFGIADQVKNDMQKLNPEYLKMSEITRNMMDDRVVPMLMATTCSSISSVKSSLDRNSGGGGFSSIGGGGGSSGGGSGGGVR